ncbi:MULTISPECIES: glycosyltransferase [Alphaproteobacteria]|nr:MULTISPECIES: glycosyltransferase [Alphaproteobacteria]
MATILYDFTRLVARRNAETPTGIDRVDLQYACHLLANFRNEVVFVAQNTGKLHYVPVDVAEIFLTQLRDRWFHIHRSSLEIDLTDEFRKFGVLESKPATVKAPPARQPAPKQKREGVTAKDVKEMHELSIFGRWSTLCRIELRGYLPRRLKWFSSAPRPLQYAVFVPISLFPSLISPLARTTSPPGTSQSRPASKQADPAVAPAEDKRIDITASPSRIATPLAIFLATQAKRPITYVNMSHHGLLDSELFIELKTAYRAEFIIYIHDIIPIEYPEYCRPGSKKDHIRRIENINKVNAFLIFNSIDTSNRVNTFFDLNFARRPKSIVSYIGADNVAHSAGTPKALFSEPYFVMVGTIEGRKNHLGLLQVWRDIAMGEKLTPKLIIIGKRGWNNASVVDMLELCDTIKPHVLELNDLADDQLFGIVRSASAMLFPSFSEGWGMPLVEALSLGVPVICSDIPVFREASRGVAEYIHPLDLQKWRTTILEYAAPESARRAAAVARIADYHPPSWQDMFDQFDAVLEKIGDSCPQIEKPESKLHNRSST